METTSSFSQELQMLWKPNSELWLKELKLSFVRNSAVEIQNTYISASTPKESAIPLNLSSMPDTGDVILILENTK